MNCPSEMWTEPYYIYIHCMCSPHKNLRKNFAEDGNTVTVSSYRVYPSMSVHVQVCVCMDSTTCTRVLAKQKKKQGGEQTNEGVLGACPPRNILKYVATCSYMYIISSIIFSTIAGGKQGAMGLKQGVPPCYDTLARTLS